MGATEIKEKNKTVLVDHFANIADEFRTSIERCNKSCNLENINRLRKTIAGIRAYVLTIASTHKNGFNHREYLEIFRRIFKLAEFVREIHVNLELIRDYNKDDLSKFEEYLKDVESVTINRLAKQVQKFDHEKFEKGNEEINHILFELPEEKIRSRAKVFVIAEMEKVRKLNSKLSIDKNLHKIRVMIKAMREILVLLNEIDPSEEHLHLIKEVEYINREFSAWYDNIMLVSYIKRYKRRKWRKPSTARIWKFQRHIRRKNRAQFKEIVSRIRETLQGPLSKAYRVAEE